MATPLRNLTITLLLAVAASACSSTADVQTTSEGSEPSSVATTVAVVQEPPVELGNISLESPTQQDIDAARATFDVWREVWNSQDIGAYTMTVGEVDDTELRLDFDADHNLVGEQVVFGPEYAETLPRSVDAVFDDASSLLEFYENSPIEDLRGHQLRIHLDAQLGVPTQWSGGDEESYPVVSFAEVTPASQTP